MRLLILTVTFNLAIGALFVSNEVNNRASAFGFQVGALLFWTAYLAVLIRDKPSKSPTPEQVDL